MSMYAHPMLRQEGEPEVPEVPAEGEWVPNADGITAPVGYHDFVTEG